MKRCLKLFDDVNMRQIITLNLLLRTTGCKIDAGSGEMLL